ncbi:MAG TPA: YbbR-like domain-containing protein [Candidatus Eisenbacteria bacterium]|nr:YbbR-like domain-containing protein [Candidatus Eisenbacteria bacterium]
MNLITEDWRLKLLALGLALLMLGAVAFAQNPVTQKVLRDVSIAYTVSPDIVVIDPPTKTNVTVTGLADALAIVNSRNVAASFDLSKTLPGTNTHVNLVVRPLIANVKVQDPVVPYVLNIDTLKAVSLAVDVRLTARPVPGWAWTKKEAQCPNAPCKVVFTGPASWETNLLAYADFTNPVQTDSVNVPAIQVVLYQNTQPLDLTKNTVPAISLDPSTVQVRVDAKPGTSSRQVVLIDAPPIRGPAPGYRITDVKVDPVTVVISGPPDTLTGIAFITLPAVDLGGATSSRTFQIPIPYREGITGPVAIARVIYTIAPNPAVSPSP